MFLCTKIVVWAISEGLPNDICTYFFGFLSLFEVVLILHGKIEIRLWTHAGLPAADAPEKKSGVHKRCWRYVPNSNKLTKSDPSTSIPIENAPTAEVQTVWCNSANYGY